MELLGLLCKGPSFVCICWAAEHEVLRCFFFVSACQAPGTVDSSCTLEILVYWCMPKPELHYSTCVNATKFLMANGIEELSGWCGPIEVFRSLPSDGAFPLSFPLLQSALMVGTFNCSGIDQQGLSEICGKGPLL